MDEQTLGTLRTYATRLLRRLKLFSGESDADDLLQDVFKESIERGFPDISSSDGPTIGYLKKNIYSRSIDRYRQISRSNAIHIPLWNDHPDQHSSPEEHTIQVSITWQTMIEAYKETTFSEEKFQESLPLLIQYIENLRSILTKLYEQRDMLQKTSIFYLAVLLLELRRSMAVFLQQHLPEDSETQKHWETLLAEHALSCTLHPFGSAIERLNPWTPPEEQFKTCFKIENWPTNLAFWQQLLPFLHNGPTPPSLEVEYFCHVLNAILVEKHQISPVQWYQWVHRAKELGTSLVSWQHWHETLGFWLPTKPHQHPEQQARITT